MLFRSLLVGAAIATLVAAPAASASPGLGPIKRCYVAAQPEQREAVEISGTGFTPLAIVDIFVDDVLQPATPPPMANYLGALAGSVRAPFVDAGQRTFSLRLTEREASGNTVSATTKVTRLSVVQSPDRASTRARVRFIGRGFTTPAPVYAHYVFAGKSRSTVRVGVPTGACGLFSVKRRQFPFKKSPRVGAWTIQFDQEQRYNPKAALRVPLAVTVKKRIKPQRAQAH